MRNCLALLVCAMAVSCTRSSYYGLNYWAKAYEPPASQAAASDEDIRESVFRYQMTHNKSIQQKKAHAYYLSVEGGQDPSAVLLQRFINSQTPVLNQSAAEITSQAPLGVFNKQTRLPGIVLSVESISRTGDTAADVIGGYVEGGQSAATNVYHLKFRSGHWVVVDATAVKPA